MSVEPRRRVVGLATFQVLDAVADTIQTQWLRDDLDHLRIPWRRRKAFPAVKEASAAGLLIGLKRPRLGRLTAVCLTLYFLLVIGAHVRVKDHPTRAIPAGVMLAGRSSPSGRSIARSSNCSRSSFSGPAERGSRPGAPSR